MLRLRKSPIFLVNNIEGTDELVEETRSLIRDYVPHQAGSLHKLEDGLERIYIISKIYEMYNKNIELWLYNTLLEKFITILYGKSFEFIKDLEQKKNGVQKQKLIDEINIFRQLSHQSRHKQVKININNLILRKLIKYTLYKTTILNDDCIDKVLLFIHKEFSL